jgi:predicted DsbA family dithiol-disulfide isomerase
MVHNDDRLTVYWDYVCPFSYLGRQSLGKYQDQRETELEIDWHPFDLRSKKRGPDGELDHPVDDDKPDVYFNRVRQKLTELQEEYGAEEMLFTDEIPEEIDSFDAQAASVYVAAEYPDQWVAFDEAVFEALWIDGRDIGDVDVLADIAEATGLDGDEIRAAVSDEELRDRLRDQFAAAQNDDISGVPTFQYDGNEVRGVVPPGQLEQLVEGS